MVSESVLIWPFTRFHFVRQMFYSVKIIVFGSKYKQIISFFYSLQNGMMVFKIKVYAHDNGSIKKAPLLKCRVKILVKTVAPDFTGLTLAVIL